MWAQASTPVAQHPGSQHTQQRQVTAEGPGAQAEATGELEVGTLRQQAEVLGVMQSNHQPVLQGMQQQQLVEVLEAVSHPQQLQAEEQAGQEDAITQAGAEGLADIKAVFLSASKHSSKARQLQQQLRRL